MSSLKRKLLPCLLIAALILSVLPATVFATAEAVTVSTEADLRAAIEAIPEGGSGEITLENVYMYLNEGLYIENKDITFNLVSAALVTAADEYGYGQPAIFGFGANITINIDDHSSMEAMGHTGNMGVVRIDNSTDWNESTQAFEKTFTLTVNGGQYACVETDDSSEDGADSVFVAAPGTKVVLTDVVCNGAVKAVAFEGVGINVPGELVIHSGKFTNDVEDYAAEGKYSCKYGENYYVREKEMTDAFSKPLTDGKIIFNYAKPTADDEAVWLISEDFCLVNPDFYFDPEGFNEDFTKLELGIFWGTAKEEFHTVDVVWDYDPAVLESAQDFIEKFPADRPWFNVTDLELVNYWVYHNPESEVDSLANYSGELKSILGNSNFLYNVEVRGGGDAPFYTERVGSAKLIHNGKVYFASTMIGARAEHAIYVPESTADTKEALIAAAQKRIDEYIGKNVVKITATDETVTDYYNSEIARYDDELATAQSELAAAQATLEAEQAKDQSLWDWDLITQCQMKIMECQNTIEYTPMYKQYFIDSFEEGGDLHFLQKAAGDFFFTVEVNDEEYPFVIIKDDTKLTVPSYATADLDTKVEVKAGSSTIPLDTVIEVEKLTEGDEYDRIIRILDVEDNETFDIKLHSGSLGEYVTKLEDGKFEVTLPIPEKFEGKDLIVYYVGEDNTPIPYEVTPVETEEGDFAVFMTDHFSIYTLAEVPTATHDQHKGGKATCNAKAICDECDQPYGEKDPSNHVGGTEIRDAKAATETAEGYTGDTYCKGCNVKIADGKAIPATGSPASPPTGETSNYGLWFALLLVSGGCLCGAAVCGKKRTA